MNLARMVSMTLVATLLLAQVALAQAPVSYIVQTEAEAAARTRIETAIAKKASLDVKDAPLRDVIRQLAKEHDIPILLSKSVLRAEGLDNPRVTASLRDISLRAVLRIVLEDFNLAYGIKDETLQIVHWDDVYDEGFTTTRLYPVKDLTGTVVDGKPVDDFDPLIELVISHTSPMIGIESGPAPISGFDNPAVLVITAPNASHEFVANLLTQLRAAKKAEQRPAAAR